ncbi:MAG: cell division protein SepF [Fimbriimonadales bacterium]|nr:cell division protein SepF [Fimbriimonadales bacterium]MDW8052536.1 cell division protein SepF [Armatimonadota bacterium]
MNRYYEEMEEQYGERQSLWTRLRTWVGLGRTEDEENLPHPQSDVRYRRFHAYYISIRKELHSLEDARIAADGLKEGVQQIINLASTPQGVRERIIDFLNGVVYAIEGSVERVSEHVFVYAPPQAIIDAPNATRAERD